MPEKKQGSLKTLFVFGENPFSYDTLCNHIYILAEGPGVARGKKIGKRRIWKKRFFHAVGVNTPRPPMSVHKKFQPNRSSWTSCFIIKIYIYIYIHLTELVMISPVLADTNFRSWGTKLKYSFTLLSSFLRKSI